MRFRRFWTRALRPLSIIAPLALLAAAAIVPPAPLLPTVAIIAVLLLAALLTLARVYELHWARRGERLFTRREAWTVALLTFLLAWWAMGIVMLNQGAGLGALAFINGMFGVLVTTGVLFFWAVRPNAASE